MPSGYIASWITLGVNNGRLSMNMLRDPVQGSGIGETGAAYIAPPFRTCRRYEAARRQAVYCAPKEGRRLLEAESP